MFLFLKNVYSYVNGLPNSKLFLFAVMLVACVFTLIASAMHDGSGKVLGRYYGKTNWFKFAFKVLSYLIGYGSFVAGCVFFVMLFLGHFTRGGGYLLIAILGLIGFVIAMFVGRGIEAGKIAKMKGKYADEINAILDSNSVFTSALKYLKEHDEIKTVRIYKDGIAFYKSILPIREYEAPYIAVTSKSHVEQRVKEELEKWATFETDSVNASKGEKVLLYEDFELQDPDESYMWDICYYLSVRLDGRFEALENRRTIDIDETTYTNAGYTVYNGVATPRTSSEKIKVKESRLAYFALLPPASPVIKEPVDKIMPDNASLKD